MGGRNRSRLSALAVALAAALLLAAVDASATVEKPINSAHVWFVNATEEPVDVYVNYADKPRITDLHGLEIGPAFEVKGTDATPYGVYTFSMRPKGQPMGEVLASASVDFSVGRSFTAALHQLPNREHRISIYENDFTPSDAPRMTVRDLARPEVITWRIYPKDLKPEIPWDEREGTLTNGQWQVADNVVQTNYRFEAFVDGGLAAEAEDISLEHEKDRTIYIVGDPYPTDVDGTRRRFVLEHEFKLGRGAPGPPVVTDPSQPYSTNDGNLRVELDCPGLEVWETNSATTVVSAVDPDGVVTNLAIAGIEPMAGGITIPDHGVAPAASIGDRATATVDVAGDVPAGDYQVTLVTNTDGMGEPATCTLPVTVMPISIARLRTLVDDYRQSGAIEASVADELLGLLDSAEQQLNAGDTARGCETLKEAVALVGSQKDKGVAVAAADHLEREMKALRADRGCG